MPNSFKRRLKRIEDNLHQKNLDDYDMTDDELAQVITGNRKAMASNISDEILQAKVIEG